MQLATPEDQTRYQTIVGKMAHATTDEVDPTALLAKMAKEESLTPPEVLLIGGVYNKSLADARLAKKASYKLADPLQALQLAFSMDDEQPPCDMPSFSLPVVEASAPPLSGRALSKAASAPRPKVDIIPRLLARDCERLQLDHRAFLRGLEKKASAAKYEFEQALNEVPEIWLREPPGALKKVAQDVINAYPFTGRKFVELVRAKAMFLPIPSGLRKTASAAIMRPTPAYTCVIRVHDAADKLRRTNRNLMLSKEAISPLMDLGSNIISNLSLRTRPHKEKTDTERILEDAWANPDQTFQVDDPDIQNDLQELKARQAFYTIVLGDDELGQYSLPELATAFNQSIATVPSSLHNPTLLRQLMLTTVEAGNKKDTFALQQELQLEKSLQEGEALRNKGKEREEDREDRREAQNKDLASRSTEAKKDRKFKRAEAKTERGARAAMASKEQKSRSKSEKKDRTFKTGESEKDRTFKTGESKKDRAHKDRTAQEDQIFKAGESVLDRTFKTGESKKDRAHKDRTAQEDQSFRSKESWLDRSSREDTERAKLSQTDLHHSEKLDSGREQHAESARQKDEEIHQKDEQFEKQQDQRDRHKDSDREWEQRIAKIRDKLKSIATMASTGAVTHTQIDKEYNAPFLP